MRDRGWKGLAAFALAVAALAALGSLAGCSVSGATDDGFESGTGRFSLTESSGDLEVYTDTETGVEYVVYTDYQRGGICPLYNPDGTLHTDGDGPADPAVYDGTAAGVVRYEDVCCPVCGEPAVADAESMVCANPGCPACGWPHGAGDSAADVLRELGYEFAEG